RAGARRFHDRHVARAAGWPRRGPAGAADHVQLAAVPGGLAADGVTGPAVAGQEPPNSQKSAIPYGIREAAYAAMLSMSSSVSLSATGFIRSIQDPLRVPVLMSQS